MIGLVFLATVINYIDRQTVSVLKTVDQPGPRPEQRRLRRDPEQLPALLRDQPAALGPALRRHRHAARLHVLDRASGRRGARARDGAHAPRPSARSASCSGSARPATGRAPPRSSASGSRCASARFGDGHLQHRRGGRRRASRRRSSRGSRLRYGWRPTFIVTGASASSGSALWLRAVPHARRPSVDHRRGARAHPRRCARRETPPDPRGVPAGCTLLGYRQTWAIVAGPLHHRSDLVALHLLAAVATCRTRAASACSRSASRPGCRSSPAASARCPAATPRAT